MWLALFLMLHPGAAAERAPRLAGAPFAKVQELKRIDFGDDATCPRASQFDPASGKLRELRDPQF